MALTITRESKFSVGDHFAVIATVQFDNAYPAGGEAITPANFGLDLRVDAVVVCGLARNPQTHDLAFAVDYDKTNAKLVLFASDDNNAADSPLLELSGLSTPITDASLYTVRVLVLGL